MKIVEKNNINDLITVVMPVYKVEKYLKRAITSVLNQTYKNLELILVDDGSPDMSGAICDEAASTDSRIKVIHQKNSGAPIARNNALDIASGAFVCFFDSDDFVNDDMLESLHNMCIENDLDLAVSGFFIDTYEDEGGSEKFFTLDYIPKDKIYKDKESFRKDAYMYFDKNMFYPPWNKMYRKSYLDKHSLRFTDTYRDDFPFVIDSIRNIEKIGFTSKQFYHFQRARAESETAKYIPNLYDKREEEHEIMINLLKDWSLYINAREDVGSFTSNDKTLAGNYSLEDKKNAMDMLSRRYLDRIIECIENFTSEKCTLSSSEIKNEVKKILACPYVDESLKYARPKRLYLKLMYVPIKLKNVTLCLLQSKFITFTKKHFLFIFNKLKVARG